MDPIALLAALTVAGAIVFAMLSLYEASSSPRSAMERRLGAVLGESNPYEVAARDASALRPKRAGSLPFFGSVLEGRAWTEDMADKLESADIGLTVSEFLTLRAMVAVVGLLPGLIIFHGSAGLLVAAVGAIAGWLLPGIHVSMARSQRMKKLDEQLPDALTMLSASLKAGFGLMQAMDMATRELEHPLSTELRRALRDINVGMATDEALQKMAKRSGSADLDIVITAMLIQQSTGGNLAEILDNVAHTMRERIRIRGEIKTLTSQQMLTGMVIGALPFALIVLFTITNPGYMTPLFTESLGRLMLIGAGMLEFIGVVIIKRILAIEV